jgi:Lipid A 3-O-deacylase (PagL)
MGSSSRVAALILFMLIASVVCVHAQVVETSTVVEKSTLEIALTAAEGDGQIHNLPAYSLKKGDNEFGFWGGIGFKATTIFGGLHEDEARDRKFFIAAFRYGRTLAANKHVALQYTLDAIPVAVATGDITQSTTVGGVTTFRRETAYGVGVTPTGLQLDFANRSHIKPFMHINGGLLVFNKSVPLPDAGKFAFVGEAGGGLRIFTSERRAVTLGVRFHHISNGDRQGANRGMNQFVVYTGFSIFK